MIGEGGSHNCVGNRSAEEDTDAYCTGSCNRPESVALIVRLCLITLVVHDDCLSVWRMVEINHHPFKMPTDQTSRSVLP